MMPKERDMKSDMEELSMAQDAILGLMSKEERTRKD
jgi:hypothetical protein